MSDDRQGQSRVMRVEEDAVQADERRSKVKVALDGLQSDARKLDVLVSGLLSSDAPAPQHVEELESVAAHIMQLSSELRLDLGAGTKVPPSCQSNAEIKETSMSSASLTHGVGIKRTPVGGVQVVIEIEDRTDADDEQVVLNKAWTQLAQAIADHKQALVDANPDLFASKPDEQAPTVADAPGSGAWWSR